MNRVDTRIFSDNRDDARNEFAFVDHLVARDYVDLHSRRPGRIRRKMARTPSSPKCKDSGKRRYGVDGLITRWFAYRARRLGSLVVSIHSRILAYSNEWIYIERERDRERKLESGRTDGH